ncbi:MAG: hypothetical protein WC241_00725 [Candidatus Paceibacterota bacterium]|jgi:DNA-directed RNA polymerase specialized sigma24 family protein
MDDSKTLKNIENKLSALLALTALSLLGNKEEVKLEVLLKKVGLEVPEISLILDKNEGAIRKTIQRAK